MKPINRAHTIHSSSLDMEKSSCLFAINTLCSVCSRWIVNAWRVKLWNEWQNELWMNTWWVTALHSVILDHEIDSLICYSVCASCGNDAFDQLQRDISVALTDQKCHRDRQSHTFQRCPIEFHDVIMCWQGFGLEHSVQNAMHMNGIQNYLLGRSVKILSISMQKSCWTNRKIISFLYL